MTELKEINFYIREDEYGWLSNFWREEQIVDGLHYPTNEHYYQSQKANYSHNLQIHNWIKTAPNAYLAMCAGRSLRDGKEKREDWNVWRVNFMLKGLRAKFKNPELRQKLLDTENAVLHEDSATDMFWGKLGQDMLGKLLMQVREELKKSAESE